MEDVRESIRNVYSRANSFISQWQEMFSFWSSEPPPPSYSLTNLRNTASTRFASLSDNLDDWQTELKKLHDIKLSMATERTEFSSGPFLFKYHELKKDIRSKCEYWLLELQRSLSTRVASSAGSLLERLDEYLALLPNPLPEEFPLQAVDAIKFFYEVISLSSLFILLTSGQQLQTRPLPLFANVATK